MYETDVSGSLESVMVIIYFSFGLNTIALDKEFALFF